MASDVIGRLNGIRWRWIGWGSAIALLAVPFVAMQLTSEVRWTPGDFVALAAMLAMVGALLELATHASSNRRYRAGAALAVLGALLTVWVNLAVGIVGSEHSPANLLFFLALGIGALGTVLVRGRPLGMAWTMTVTAIAVGAAFVTAIQFPTDEPNVGHGLEAIGTSVFAVLFLASAALFRKAARSA